MWKTLLFFSGISKKEKLEFLQLLVCLVAAFSICFLYIKYLLNLHKKEIEGAKENKHGQTNTQILDLFIKVDQT